MSTLYTHQTENVHNTYVWIVMMCMVGLVFPHISHAERIKNFSSDIIINDDATVQVVETITYDFEGASKHGIFRDIPLNNNDGSFLDIENVSVIDEQGMSYQKSLSEDKLGIHIKIGDPNSLVSGIKTYKISYVVKNALVSFDVYDELYWNITGDQWSIPIDHVTATVITTPKIIQSSCYRGNFGSSEKCSSFKTGDVTVNENTIDSGEGVTVAVGFQKGFISGITRIGGQIHNDLINNPKRDPRGHQIILYIFGGILFLGIVIIKIFTRDKSSKRSLMAHYEPPRGLTPIQAGVVIDKGLDFRDVTAQMISLAERGYIKIAYLEKKVLRVFNAVDYQFTLTKSPVDSSAIDIKILNFIFGDNLQEGVTITLTEMSGRSRLVSKKLFEEMQKVEEQYFIDQGFFKKNNLRIVAGILMGVLVVSLLYVQGESIIFTVLVAVVGIIAMTIHSRILTDEGAELKQEVLGFKEFLAMTDKERFDFHNAPERKPEQFMKYLPYAIAFRVEEKWSKQFEGMMLPESSWYQGGTNQAFSAYVFTNQMTSLGTSLGSLAKAATSGSGGSGSSGGGSGGGGGGSW